MAFRCSPALTQYLGVLLYLPICSLAFPATGVAGTLPINSSTTAPVTAVTPYTLPHGCLDSVTNTLPSQQTWQVCNTTGWLEDLINTNNATLRNSTWLQAHDGFIGAFSLATQVMSCPYAQTCSIYPTYPPAEGTSADDIQKAIVQMTLYYLSSWYEAANNMLINEEILKQSLEGEIATALIIQSLPVPPDTGVSMGSILGLVGSILSIISNPYTAVAGALLTGISALMPAPAPTDPDAAALANIAALGDLDSQLSAGGGVAFTLATNTLANRFAQLFTSDVDPMSDEGMFTMLQDGSWLDHSNNAQNPGSIGGTTPDWLAYNWVVSQVLQTQKVFLHALVVPECPTSTLGIQGNNCASYENVNFVYWPAIWNSAASTSVEIPGYGSASQATTVQDLTRHPNGGLIFSELVPGLDQTVDANFLFQTSLLCQLSANTQNDLLAPWPAAPANTVFTNSIDASCLYNLPIIIDEQGAALPSDVGLLSSISTPAQTSGCAQSPITSTFYSTVQQFTGSDLRICNTAWSLDEYAAIALGLVSNSDPTQYWFCGNLAATMPLGASCNGQNPNIGGCGIPGPDGGCLCVQNGGELVNWGLGAQLSCGLF